MHGSARRVMLLAAALMSCDDAQTPPAECKGDAVYGRACAGALDARCREQTTREDCEEQGPFPVDDLYTSGCNWAQRVALTDLATCSAGQPAHVCVAVYRTELFACADGCSGDASSENTLQAGNSGDELIILSCPDDGSAVFGPLDAKNGYSTCSPSTQPTGRAELCACREQVCQAVEGM